jgi:AICAR transformylase/IMP cyclohydrolase PurH
MHQPIATNLRDTQKNGAMREECRLAETVEISVWRDLAAAAPPDLRRDTRVEAIDVGGVLALRAAVRENYGPPGLQWYRD